MKPPKKSLRVNFYRKIINFIETITEASSRSSFIYACPAPDALLSYSKLTRTVYQGEDD